MPTFITAQHCQEGIGEDASLRPLLQPEVTRRARAELAGQSVPLTAGAEAVDDAGEHLPVRYSWPPSSRFGPLWRQERLDRVPELVRHGAILRIHATMPPHTSRRF